jgi:large subunit ribosomal protein L21
MYAVIETGGKQYRVAEGDTLQVELLPGADAGGEVTFDRVLLVGGETVMAGTPAVEGASVRARVLREGKEPKVLVFKMKRRKAHRKLRGHRQPFTEVRIEQILLPKGN